MNIDTFEFTTILPAVLETCQYSVMSVWTVRCVERIRLYNVLFKVDA